MSLSKNDIRDRVASDYLGILPLGQALQHQDSTRILQAYNEVYEYLKEKKLATWAFTASVPTELVPYIVVMVAENCHQTYGVSQERLLRIQTDFIKAEPKIRGLVFPEYISQEDPKDY